MKSTILNLNKRVLVAEIASDVIYSTSKEQLTEIVKKNLNLKDINLLGLGSELSEEIAKELCEYIPEILGYLNFRDGDDEKVYADSALDSFISAIEANGYYWSENPIEEPTMAKYGWYASGSPYEDSGWMYEEGEEKYYEALKDFEEAESKTFQPEQVILFEILK